MLKKIGNDLSFFTGYLTFRTYDSIWRKATLPMYSKLKENLRKPTKACLPQNDSDYRLRHTLIRQNARHYQSIKNTFINIPTFELNTFLKKEFHSNIILASPTLSFSVLDYLNDGRIINSDKDIRKIVKKFRLIDSMTRLTDYNAYQLNPAIDILKILDDNTRNNLSKLFDNAIFYSLDVESFVNEFNDKKYYFQDCDAINKQFNYEVYGLYIPYDDNGKKRLQIETIILVDRRTDNTKTYVFQSNFSQWEIIRNNYINWTRTMSSVYEHQLGSNVYCQNTLYHMRKTLAKNHPITVLMKPFMEGVYFTNKVFTSFGISIADTENEVVNRYMDRVELFDLSNQTMTQALDYIHKTDGYKLLDYAKVYHENGIDDIYFEQKQLLENLYQIVFDLVTNVFEYYYQSTEDYVKDNELRDFYLSVKNDLPFIEDLQEKNNAVKFFSNIIFLSSIRHSKNHINYAYLNSFYDYALRKTNFDLLLDKLDNDILFDEKDCLSTVGDFYSKYSSGIYPSVPINLFGSGYKNLFADKEVQKFFTDVTNKLNQLKKNTERNNYTEFLFRLQNSNTI